MTAQHVWKLFPLVKYTNTQIIHKYTNKKCTNTQKAQHLWKLFPPIGHTCQAPTQRTKSHTCHIKVPLGGASTSPLPFCKALCICVFVHLCICAFVYLCICVLVILCISNLQKSFTCASKFYKSYPYTVYIIHITSTTLILPSLFLPSAGQGFYSYLDLTKECWWRDNSGIHVSSKAIAVFCITWPITLWKIGLKIKSFVFVFHLPRNRWTQISAREGRQLWGCLLPYSPVSREGIIFKMFFSSPMPSQKGLVSYLYFGIL